MYHVQNGLTPLHVAVCCKHKIIISELLEHDADINIQDNDGNTPLMVACSLGHADLVEMLLDYDADTDVKNKQG